MFKARFSALSILDSCFYRFSTACSKSLNQYFLADGTVLVMDNAFNVPRSILSKIGKQLHTRNDHPLGIIRNRIEAYFAKSRFLDQGSYFFKCYDNLSPIVSIVDNFDNLCFPSNHPGRSPTDTYYINSNHVLRTHTTAHDVSLMSSQSFIHNGKFITIGDVYRRDEIDSVHYPVFHQVEGVCLFSRPELSFLDKKYEKISSIKVSNIQPEHINNQRNVELVVTDMKREIEGLMKNLFGHDILFEWIPGEFPFTSPSYELEIILNGKRLEVCGCGVLKNSILEKAYGKYHDSSIAWAFGFGLERLAMVLFDIPDIRYFWSEDSRFISQFSENANNNFDDFKPIKFVPLSKYPPNIRDLSFWLSGNAKALDFDHNTVYEIIREEASDLVESAAIVSI